MNIKRSKVSREMEATENKPFAHHELKEWGESLAGKRGQLDQLGPNRKERRMQEPRAAVMNNRSNPKKRANVLTRMQYFSLARHGKLTGLSR